MLHLRSNIKYQSIYTKFMKQSDLIKYSLLFLLTFLIIDYSPLVLSREQPDSDDYLNLHASRQVTYYFIIQMLNTIGLDLFFFQKFLLSLSIICLFLIIKRRVNIYLSLLAFFLIVSNFYYTSFSKTILTEALFFTFINLTIFLLFDLNKLNKIIFFSILCGIISSLKPIGIPFSIILILIAIIQIKKLNQILLMIFFFVIPNILENLLFYNSFDQRESVFKYSILGKLTILSGKDSFKISNYPKNLEKFLVVTKKEFEPIHKYLDNIDNIFLKSELLSDYEVLAQYQTFNLESVKKADFEETIIFESSSKVFFHILKNNLPDYLLLSFYHYIGNWSIGSKARFLNNNKNEVPKYKELVKSSGPMNIPNLRLIELAQYYFLLLFFILTFYTVLSLLSLCNVIRWKMKFESFSIIFLIQSYLTLVSLTNVSTPRYLMPIYPILVILSIKFIILLQKIMKK